jgi:hypothetical protein
MKNLTGLISALVVLALVAANGFAAPIRPGEVITPGNAALVADLVSPGNFVLVKQGMRMKIVPTGHLEWPPPYKSATEKYSAQVRLNDKGELDNYLAGLPFPLLDPNDPQVATKVMWNFSFRPQYTDDADIREVELESYSPTSSGPLEHFRIGHVAFYFNLGRTEVPPIPSDSEGTTTGIRYRFGAFPLEEPAEVEGTGFVRYRYADPAIEDNTWGYSRASGRVKRLSASVLSDVSPPRARGRNAAASFVNNLDPDSAFGFAAKIEDFNYRLLGIKPMLASVEAANVPAHPCDFDNHRTVCPENWELRQLYAVEATERPQPWHRKIGSDGLIIPKRVFYIDSEGWFITASDQYDRQENLWKTLATFNTYRDRPVPDAKVAIYPFKWIFQTALVDEDVQSGYSTVAYTPGQENPERECWYINMGIVTRSFLDPHRMAMTIH